MPNSTNPIPTEISRRSIASTAAAPLSRFWENGDHSQHKCGHDDSKPGFDDLRVSSDALNPLLNICLTQSRLLIGYAPQYVLRLE